eukprot:Sro991_g228750.1 n/a (275) ;mRNA; r:37170-38183
MRDSNESVSWGESLGDTDSVSGENTSAPAERLSEARPVTEDDERVNLPDAVPYDEDTLDLGLQRRKLERNKTLGYLILLLMFGVVSIVAVVAAKVSSSAHHKNEDKTPVLRTSTPSSGSSSSSPSMGPTMAPTSLLAMNLLAPSTSMAVATPMSPQNRAYHFMKGEYNITGKSTNDTTCNQYGVFTRLHVHLPGQMAGSGTTSMPPEIALLPALEEINLGNIGINGHIEHFLVPELKQLTSIKRIGLASNGLTGPIQDSVFDCLPTASVEEFTI